MVFTELYLLDIDHDGQDGSEDVDAGPEDDNESDNENKLENDAGMPTKFTISYFELCFYNLCHYNMIRCVVII